MMIPRALRTSRPSSAGGVGWPAFPMAAWSLCLPGKVQMSACETVSSHGSHTKYWEDTYIRRLDQVRDSEEGVTVICACLWRES